jgi:hypothetical protein
MKTSRPTLPGFFSDRSTEPRQLSHLVRSHQAPATPASPARVPQTTSSTLTTRTTTITTSEVHQQHSSVGLAEEISLAEESKPRVKMGGRWWRPWALIAALEAAVLVVPGFAVWIVYREKARFGDLAAPPPTWECSAEGPASSAPAPADRPARKAKRERSAPPRNRPRRPDHSKPSAPAHVVPAAAVPYETKLGASVSITHRPMLPAR